MRTKHIIIFSAWIALLFTHSAQSDECVNPPVTEALVLERLCDVAAAYTAYVVSYGEKARDPRERPVINLEVTELFRGGSDQLTSVLSPGYAGPHFTVGEEALIFAYELAGADNLEVRPCSISGPISRTSEYLEPIRQAMSEFKEHCSESSRKRRAEVLRDQSEENLRRIKETNSGDFEERHTQNDDSSNPDSNEP